MTFRLKCWGWVGVSWTKREEKKVLRGMWRWEGRKTCRLVLGWGCPDGVRDLSADTGETFPEGILLLLSHWVVLIFCEPVDWSLPGSSVHLGCSKLASPSIDTGNLSTGLEQKCALALELRVFQTSTLRLEAEAWLWIWQVSCPVGRGRGQGVPPSSTTWTLKALYHRPPCKAQVGAVAENKGGMNTCNTWKKRMHTTPSFTLWPGARVIPTQDTQGLGISFVLCWQSLLPRGTSRVLSGPQNTILFSRFCHLQVVFPQGWGII